MSKQGNKISELPKVTTRGSKSNTLNALNQLGYTIQKLVHTQKTLVLDTNKNSSSALSDESRLRIYDKSLREIVMGFESLATQINVKQAGGRRIHKEFNLGCQIARTRYKETGKFIPAKELVKELNKRLRGKAESLDINGNEPMSLKIARECIKLIKISLPHEDI
jgi:hypothetical protein